MIKRVVIIIVILVIAAAGVVVWQIVTPQSQRIGMLRGIVGSTQAQVEQWVGGQVKAIANEYLKPELRFARMQYEAPGTVLLHEVELISDGEPILLLQLLTLTLAEIPQVGKPIVIEKLSLDAPTMRFIETDNGLLGWGDLVEPGSGEVRADGGSTKLSDVFAIAKIAVQNASIAYEQPDQPRMLLDGMSFDLDAEPVDADGDGWHRITTRLDREHLLDVDIDGRVNLDSVLLDLQSVIVRASLRESTYRFFPPQLQAWLASYSAQGDVAVEVGGMLNLSDMAASTMRVHAMITDAFATQDDYRLPMQAVDFAATLEDRKIDVSNLTIAAFGGTAVANAAIDLSPQGVYAFEIDMAGMRVEEFLATRLGSTDRPKYAGRIDMRMTLGGESRDAVASAAGMGTLTAVEGRFGDLPVIGDIVRMIAGLQAAGPKYDDRLSTELIIRDRKAELRSISLTSTAIAVRGEGEIGFDQSLNLRLNGGPLEAVQNALGRIGRILGGITDQFVTYQVRGTLAEPTINIRPLGIGASAD